MQFLLILINDNVWLKQFSNCEDKRTIWIFQVDQLRSPESDLELISASSFSNWSKVREALTYNDKCSAFLSLRTHFKENN